VTELSSSFLVVILGVASAAAWGTADFSGGIASRRAPLLGVLFFGQMAGMAAAAALWAIRGEAVPTGADLAWSIAAGVAGWFALGCLYRGFQVGRMGVVAPVSGALGAAIPVVVGMLIQGVPPPIAIAGIVLAVVSIVLVSFVADDRSRGPSGLPWALGAAVGMGTYNVLVNQISDGHVAGPLTILRLVQVVLGAVAIAAARRPWRIPPPARRIVVTAGVLDMAGNVFFIGALQVGALAIASVLAALYPVVTLLLAIAILRERITGAHAFGVIAAVVAIGLIAAGSA